MNEIQHKYHEVEVDVVRKDGLILTREMAVEVKNMMDFKMSAVMRIMDSAEQAALSPKPGTVVSAADGASSSSNGGGNMRYYNAHKLAADGRLSNGGREVILTPNRHFDHLPVNTSISSVLMPTPVTDSDAEVQNSIQWSEHLDPLFANNYETDPSLSWQYFGSSLGFLRRYPAIAWPPEDPASLNAKGEKTDRDDHIYDFRHSAWFVDAATSPKDLVILLDASGSMTGQRSQLAAATVREILDTLGSNDYVNVFKFSDYTEEIVPCFKDLLVQASPENKRDLKNALDTIRPENIANFTSALVTAFEILHKYNRTGQGCQCNQAIMLITDGPPSTFQDILQMYNMPHRLVRIFTYLIGKDSSNAAEMSWIACNNKGYYKRISSLNEIPESVQQYIFVMARPMVMYQNNHPIQWTPVYMGGKSSSLRPSAPMQLMTSVTTPVFDRRNHSVRVANLLGVVGTDVPIEQIIKLVPPYKLGVNGYSFIVNNNGHVLYHPDLRPLVNNKFEKSLEPEYTSIDLTEVELVENESGPRENNSMLLDLRHDMIDQKEGEIELSVKVHYDNMKRVTTRKHKYFYNPIEGTPFSLGLAIPEGYGMYEVIAEQEIKHSPVNVTEYFKGTNWKVHPDWVYCEYNSVSEQYLGTAEDRVLHFLSRTRAPGWKWMSMRPRAPPLGPLTTAHGPVIHHVQTTPHKKTEKDSYYCDKTLMQSLVQDAIVTEGMDKHSSTHSTHKEDKHPIATLMALLHRQGYQMFGVTLSFIATRSGLLRWIDHATTSTDSNEPHFSELNTRATDETWYRRAVDQHAIEPESFVFSVPFDADEMYARGGIGQRGPLVTATHAIFIERKGHRAPAAVVGLQFQHSTLASHFINITSACTGTTACRKTCASDELDCYVLDNNGFVILSESPEHTGKFFGQIDGTIMDSLVQDRIYKKVAVYDYQGACSSDKSHFNKGVKFISPLQPLGWFFEWTIGTLSFWFSMMGQSYAKSFSYANDDDYEYDTYVTDDINMESEPQPAGPSSIPNDIKRPTPEVNKEVTRTTSSTTDSSSGTTSSTGGHVYPCDKRVDLYILQPDRLNTSGLSNPLKGKLTNCHITGCERPFSVQKIPHSNLILLVVDTLCPCGSKQLSIGAYEVLYDTSRCRVKPMEALYRRRPPKCINYHPEEIEIKLCGNCGKFQASIFLEFLTIAFTLSRFT
ncbi:voltage-dependent calcium channel subunit alpha-2/delta-3 [Chrysoperla carnea]|uniref:voltage-dependent calcium channel subunit alpha-2/delta-3 n=1 Tax=Chrysoperla carnea TaxID=189513 RepID=UPI001D07C038|nr:voltage-dependent calcium channel subunit alpha-2/delta-3 [Chrysoperla carnea]